MGLGSRLKQKLRTFMERPGTTVSLSRYEAILPKIRDLEDELEALTDAEFTERALGLRDDVSGPEDGEPVVTAATPLSIDERDLIEICAMGREAGRRALGERAFDVQLLGAMAMMQGNVVEMATGEGKTLAAVIAAFGYVVRGSRVQVLTVNDYLADRDARWMGPAYRLLGLTVGSVGEGDAHDERAAAYRCDVTYVSVSEAGFDFLRDQLVLRAEDAVMPGLYTVIIDEADSILIDEARVPLVVAGSLTDGGSDASAAALLVAGMRQGRDFEVVDDGRNVQLTDAGAALVERAWGGLHLYAQENLNKLTAVNLALHARALLAVDVDYIVKDDRIALVDEFRGRVARRRRWPDGLQAAVEAKEGLTATDEGEILATITVQAFIALYPTVAGMTGTASTIGDELREFYKLEVAVIPPNTENIRVDEPDRVYATIEEKEEALMAEVAEAHETGRPVLVGTLDVAESERLAAALQEHGIDCAVLNAKNDAHEAAVIAEAGRRGVVTVSTQMAGRGTDIRLGGSDGEDRAAVAELGGLYVIGAGRHDSRRVDDQLRGRAGRQGDPGGSMFFVSREDELIVRHGDGIGGTTAGDGRVTGPAVHWAVGHAQRVAEGVDFEIHRNTWRYGVLVEQQRQVLALRRKALLTTDAAAQLLREDHTRFPADPDAVAEADLPADADADDLAHAGLEMTTVAERYAEVVNLIGEQAAEEAVRQIALYHLDRGWADHLGMLADVRDGVHLRALGRQDPLDEFHRLAVPAFSQMLDGVNAATAETFLAARIDSPDWTPAEVGLERPSATWTYMVHDNPFGSEIERFISGIAKAVLGR
ncbi:protein translocase subunit SecA [Catellatospora methionotrophica]|uniref:Protein translocase subunit SecA n=1 Tax=Catellatospora methionotrophica TaxID=121620 RepID=A0A8J3L5T8_9ACTN|nr:accessory Sec system translocase SecA2 [Catellatospora methionotrophica]GIG14952.1 protein translocase subunit SecA [Catellatospora methionotrophica]